LPRHLPLDRGGDARYDAGVRLVLVVLLLAVRAAAAPGRAPVGVATLVLDDATRGRVLTTEVWYPSTAGGRDARARRGRFPLVLVAHGFCGFRTNYEYLTTRLAAYGFLVAAPDFPGWNHDACAAGQIQVDLDAAPGDLAFVAAALRAPGGRLPRPRGRRAALVGHSLGGMVVANAAAASPADYPAVLMLAPAAGSAQSAALAAAMPRPAVLVVAGAADTTVRLPGVQTFFAGLVAPAYLVTLAAGTHGGFTDVDAGLAADALGRQESLTARYATAFLERYLARRRRFRRVLTPADAAAQGDDVTLVAAPAS
jgi:dienelactone hydrolase